VQEFRTDSDGCDTPMLALALPDIEKQTNVMADSKQTLRSVISKHAE
jgi:hypothetical protein